MAEARRQLKWCRSQYALFVRYSSSDSKLYSGAISNELQKHQKNLFFGGGLNVRSEIAEARLQRKRVRYAYRTIRTNRHRRCYSEFSAIFTPLFALDNHDHMKSRFSTINIIATTNAVNFACKVCSSAVVFALLVYMFKRYGNRLVFTHTPNIAAFFVDSEFLVWFNESSRQKVASEVSFLVQLLIL